MDRQLNTKYFTAKGGGALMIAGIVIAAIGLLALFLFWELAAVGAIIAIVGIVMAFISTGKKVKDSDIDEGLAREAKAFEETFVDKFITDHSRAGGLKVSADAPKPKRRGKPEYFGCYWFKDVQFVKRGGDGKARSSTHCFAGILIDPDQLSLGKSLFSLVSEDKDEVWVQAPFTDLEKAELIDPEADSAYTQFVRYTILRVTKKDGSLFAEIPLTADATADKMRDEINQAIGRFAKAE